MHTTNLRRARLLVIMLTVFALFTAACGDDDDTTEADSGSDSTAAPAAEEEPAEEPAEAPALEGSIAVSGSSTVFPIVQKQAEEFAAANPGVAISVDGPGSGDGAALFCDGEIPIGNASRAYKDSELETCAANGIEFIEIRRGIDGISVITSANNNAVECVSFSQIYALLSEEATGFDSWADANALLAEMGSTAGELPDAPLDIFGPGEESGTFDSFGEIVIEAVAKGKTGLDTEARDFVKTIRPDYTSSPNDNVIIEGIASSDTSLGWVGFAFAKEAEEAGEAKLLAVAKEDGGECVVPTPETIASADFPISRFLYTYVNAEMADSDPAVAAFVDYMMSDAGLESVTAVGYIDLAEADQQLAQSVWANRITGRSFSG
ncbi:MAG: substrate-binding domain-containing protein [Actinomycetota bacterium]|nr:substrate-binding domain-containing protein [Actinomycetota bacterium]MEC7374814.1 substrate-binding domain-containing protein [Actinomycetota bacterium]MEC7402831.1 substrate-binding domain-containing protein [Actinomycetota bacterium]MEC7507352.1 substrate-binding domain-containing protein [Actinomycetota bacterium]MEC7672530.1 substrate-binding domain-containing protein [Actinomycetota bacterium]